MGAGSEGGGVAGKGSSPGRDADELPDIGTMIPIERVPASETGGMS